MLTRDSWKSTEYFSFCAVLNLKFIVDFCFVFVFNVRTCSIHLSEVQTKTGAEHVYNGNVGSNLGRHLLFCSQIPPHNAVRDEFGTNLFMYFGKANFAWDQLVKINDAFLNSAKEFHRSRVGIYYVLFFFNFNRLITPFHICCQRKKNSFLGWKLFAQATWKLCILNPNSTCENEIDLDAQLKSHISPWLLSLSIILQNMEFRSDFVFGTSFSIHTVVGKARSRLNFACASDIKLMEDAFLSAIFFCFLFILDRICAMVGILSEKSWKSVQTSVCFRSLIMYFRGAA